MNELMEEIIDEVEQSQKEPENENDEQVGKDKEIESQQ